MAGIKIGLPVGTAALEPGASRGNLQFAALDLLVTVVAVLADGFRGLDARVALEASCHSRDCGAPSGQWVSLARTPERS
jgi:hypothetical protein